MNVTFAPTEKIDISSLSSPPMSTNFPSGESATTPTVLWEPEVVEYISDSVAPSIANTKKPTFVPLKPTISVLPSGENARLEISWFIICELI